MKKGIHPEYSPVVFMDGGSGFKILSASTKKSSQTVEWEDGKTYPLIVVDVTSDTHPFFTGKQKLLDTGGRVDKFKKRMAQK